MASINKMVVGLAVLKLWEQGRLSLDARVSDLAPGVRIENRWDATDPVRLVHLLEHTAGFDDMEPGEFYNRRDDPMIPLAEVLRRFPRPQQVRWRPGTMYAYSNPGYGLAGYVIERVTRRPFEEYAEEEILDPVGMIHSDFRLTDESQLLLAQGYTAAGVPLPYTPAAASLLVLASVAPTPYAPYTGGVPSKALFARWSFSHGFPGTSEHFASFEYLS